MIPRSKSVSLRLSLIVQRNSRPSWKIWGQMMSKKIEKEWSIFQTRRKSSWRLTKWRAQHCSPNSSTRTCSWVPRLRIPPRCTIAASRNRRSTTALSRKSKKELNLMMMKTALGSCAVKTMMSWERREGIMKGKTMIITKRYRAVMQILSFTEEKIGQKRAWPIKNQSTCEISLTRLHHQRITNIVVVVKRRWNR